MFFCALHCIQEELDVWWGNKKIIGPLRKVVYGDKELEKQFMENYLKLSSSETDFEVLENKGKRD